MKKKTGWLLAILAMAAGLRLLLIGTRSIQYDDAFSLLLAERSLLEIVQGTAADTMPPLFYFLLHFWGLIQPGIVFARLLSVLLSLGTVWLVYELVRLVSGSERGGLAAAFLAAVSPLQIYHAQDIRMYALVMLAEAGYLVCFFHWIRAKNGARRRSLFAAGMILCAAAALYSHNLAGFGLIVPNAYLLLKRDWKNLGRLLALQLLVGVFFAPWLVYLPGQLQKIQAAFWTPRPGVIELVQALVMLVASLPLPGVWLWAGVLIALQVVVLTAIEAARLYRKEAQTRDALVFFGLLLLLPPALLFGVSYLIRPVFVPRGFLISSAGLFGLAGLVIARQWKAGGGKLLLGLFVLAAVISIPYQITYRAFPRSPFAEAAAYLSESQQPGDVIVNDNKLSHFPLAVYAPELEMKFLADEVGSANDTLAPATQAAMDLTPEGSIAAAAGSADRLRFIVFAKTLEEYAQKGSAHPAIRWLVMNYALTSKEVFGDLEVRTYER